MKFYQQIPISMWHPEHDGGKRLDRSVWGRHVNGLTINASNHNYGILGDTKGTYYASHVKVSNAKTNGIYVNNAETVLYLSDSEITNSQNSGHQGQIDARNGGTIIADNVNIHDGKGIGVYSNSGGRIEISNSIVTGHGLHGMSVQNGSTLIASGMTVVNTRHSAVDSKHDGTYLQLTDSNVTGYVTINEGWLRSRSSLFALWSVACCGYMVCCQPGSG